MWRTHSCVQRSHSCERFFCRTEPCGPKTPQRSIQSWGTRREEAVPAKFEARSHECERCTQECVRHDLIGIPRQSLLFILLRRQASDHSQVFESCHIASDCVRSHNLSQQAAHDFAAAGLR